MYRVYNYEKDGIKGKVQISVHLLIFVHSEHVRLFDFVLHPFRFRILFVHN